MPKQLPHHTHEVYAARDTHKHKAGEVAGYYSNQSRATRAQDRLDNEYGGYVYRTQRVKNPIESGNDS